MFLEAKLVLFCDRVLGYTNWLGSLVLLGPLSDDWPLGSGAPLKIWTPLTKPWIVATPLKTRSVHLLLRLCFEFFNSASLSSSTSQFSGEPYPRLLISHRHPALALVLPHIANSALVSVLTSNRHSSCSLSHSLEAYHDKCP